jgi:hypothetical protein
MGIPDDHPDPAQGDVMNDSVQTTELFPSAPATEVGFSAWCDLDERFFRIVAEELSPRFLAGASALLGSYDQDDR